MKKVIAATGALMVCVICFAARNHCLERRQSIEQNRLFFECLIHQLAQNPASVTLYNAERRELVLSFLGIRAIPATFFEQIALVLPDLQSLDLAGNSLSEIPASIGFIQNLRILVLSGNHLQTLPNSLGNLEHLTHLFLGNNRFSSLPSVNLPHLRLLDMSANLISDVRAEDIALLARIQRLFLGGNNLHSLSEALTTLPFLEYVCLYGTPDQILEDPTVAALQNRGVVIERHA